MCLPLHVSVLLSQCPLTWQNKWDGPEEPMQYLRAVVTRALAIQVTHITYSPSSTCSLTHFSLNVLRHHFRTILNLVSDRSRGLVVITAQRPDVNRLSYHQGTFVSVAEFLWDDL